MIIMFVGQLVHILLLPIIIIIIIIIRQLVHILLLPIIIVQSSKGGKLGKGILGGTLGAGVGGFAFAALESFTSFCPQVLSLSGPTAPVVAVGGAIGFGIGALFGLFS
jgi:hypothetical protein